MSRKSTFAVIFVVIKNDKQGTGGVADWHRSREKLNIPAYQK